MQIYSDEQGRTVNAISSLYGSDRKVAGYWYDLHGTGGYFAQLIFQRSDARNDADNGGVTTEAVLHALLHRLEHLDSILPCPENVAAISHLQQALIALNYRTEARMSQGVYGTDQTHESVLLDIGAAREAEAAEVMKGGDAPAGEQPAEQPKRASKAAK